jgi:hypothetical protein
MSERPSVDPKCYDLAEHFLADLPGSSIQQIWELAGILQRAAEDYLEALASAGTRASSGPVGP